MVAATTTTERTEFVRVLMHRLPSGKGANHCTLCTAGKFPRNDLITECQDCDAGEHQNKEGQTACHNCPVGQYQNSRGRKLCLSCTSTYSTGKVGSSSLLDCVCEAETYLAIADPPKCLPCTEGLTCEIGSSMFNLRQYVCLQVLGFSCAMPRWTTR